MIDKFPHKIKFNSKISYEVLFVSDYDDPTQMGACDPNKRQITIKSNISDKEKIKTLTHEWLHLASFETDDLALTERQVQILEDQLIKVFKNNPRFFNLFCDLIRGKIKK